MGIVDTQTALRMAEGQGLDLVEVSPKARPPVCRIMDYGKFKYRQSKRGKEAKKKQHVMSVKEIRLRPKTDEHDYAFKMRHARGFLQDRNKVKVTVTFYGRERAHQEFGTKMLERALQDLEDVAVVERSAHMEGRNMTMVLAPK